MKIEQTKLSGVVIIEPTVYTDQRGYFFECYHFKKFAAAGIDVQFVQDNQSKSARNTVRGLHYQINPGQGKLIRVVSGEIFDVAVDIRWDSPTFSQWVGVRLSADNKKQFFIPVGFAHGFCVVSDVAEVHYKCTDYYSPSDERGIIWNDPQVAIEWPVEQPILSARDQQLPAFNQIERDFDFGGVQAGV